MTWIIDIAVEMVIGTEFWEYIKGRDKRIWWQRYGELLDMGWKKARNQGW